MKKFLWLFLFLFLLTGCGKEKPAERGFFAMDTYMTFTAYGPNGEAALEKAEARVHEIEDALSVTKEGSDLSRVNHGEDIALGEDAERVISAGLSLGKETDGALDISLYPLSKAWGFTTGKYRVPEKAEIKTLLSQKGIGKISISGNHIQKPSGMEIDLGALGKGYAGSEAKRIVKEAGVTSAILSLGGNIETLGEKPDGSPWRVGIKSPLGDGNGAVLSVRNQAVITSGTYERYFIDKDGRKRHHILNPKTGEPVENTLLSLTVVTDDGLLGDGLSTALFVMGKEKAKVYWKAHPGLELLLIEKSGEITITEGLEKCMEIPAGGPCYRGEVWRR